MVQSIKKITIIFTFSLSLLCIFYGSLSKAHAASLDFDVNPVGKTYYDMGYFKMTVKPNQTIDLPVQFKSYSNKSITIDIDKVNALTSIYGNIQYVSTDHLQGSTLMDKNREMNKYVTGITTLTLQPNEQKIVHFTLTTPSNIQDGTLLGGLLFKKHEEQTNNSSKTKGIVITNKFARVIGIVANYQKSISPTVLLGNNTIQTTASSPNVLVDIQNPSPVIADNISFEYTVYQGNKELFNGKSGTFKMAPSTDIGYPIAWQYKTFAAGNYKMNMTLYDGVKKIEKTYNVNVPEQAVKTYQKLTRPVAVIETNIWIYIIDGLAIILSIAAITFVLWKRKNDKEKKENVKKTI